MSDPIFRPDDFTGGVNHTLTIGNGIDGKYISLANVLTIANAKLERLLGPVVRCYAHKLWYDTTEQTTSDTDTHTARLFNVQPLAKVACEHEPKAFWFGSGPKQFSTNARGDIMCGKCGVELRPTWQSVEGP